jgi:hypothetical protein
MKTLISDVPDYEGECTPVWLHGNQVLDRLDGGATGFFKRVSVSTICGLKFKARYGEEFHGIISNGRVISTEGRYS